MATSTATDEGFHEIQLNGKQLVFLFMAVTVVSVVIFLLGVLVGRGVRLERGGTEPLVAQASTPVPNPPAVGATPGSTPPATARENLDYPKRLGTATPPREQLKPANEAAAASAPRPTEPAPAVTTPPAAPAAANRATSPPSPAPASPTPAPAALAEPAGAGFAIQLTALGRRSEAESIARRLNGKGYSAYVVNPDAGAPAVFRVRVGKFKDRRDAESVKARLEKEEQFKPWIVR